MNTPDPFASFESERTIIKPKPRAAAPAPAAAGPAPMAGGGYEAAATADLSAFPHLNPLVAAANTLLGLIAQVRQTVQHPNPGALRATLIQAVQDFETAARRNGVANEKLIAARYILCTAVDEAVANTPWGAQAAWNQQSLLVHFHNETWGGEKVFQLLAKLAQDAPANRDLLELIYCVVALGFEGRYRVLDNGASQLDSVRTRLAAMIAQNRPPVETELSPQWRGLAGIGQAARASVPLWMIALGLLTVLALAYAGLQFALNRSSDPVYAAIQGLREPLPATAPAAAPLAAPRLAKFLEAEIREGLVSVREDADRSVISLRGDSFFAPASADLQPRAIPVVVRVAKALAEVQGQVLITGHSDNQPIRSIRYPSNWHLSQARAQSVLDIVQAQVQAQRLKAEGRAESEPVAPNDTPDNRARNRRVELMLLVPAGGAQGATK
jgi:type VI secretion system protein ImpK